MLNFETNPKQISVGKNVDLKYGLIDENTDKSISHITSILSIFRKDDGNIYLQKLFTVLMDK
jgi:hypothetical protein